MLRNLFKSSPTSQEKEKDKAKSDRPASGSAASSQGSSPVLASSSFHSFAAESHGTHHWSRTDSVERPVEEQQAEPAMDLFSGLTLQVDSEGRADDAQNSTGQAHDSAPDSSIQQSGFSFMNSTPNSGSADNPEDAPSSFSFITSSAPIEESEGTVVSSFSFMNTEAPTVPATLNSDEQVEEQNEKSVFDFLNATVSSEPITEPANTSASTSPVVSNTPSTIPNESNTPAPQQTNKAVGRNRPNIVKKTRSGVIRPGYAREPENSHPEPKSSEHHVQHYNTSRRSSKTLSEVNSDFHSESQTEQSAQSHGLNPNTAITAPNTVYIPTTANVSSTANAESTVSLERDQPQKSTHSAADSSWKEVTDSTVAEPPSSYHLSDDTSSVIAPSITTETDNPSHTHNPPVSSEAADQETADSLAHYSRTSSFSSEGKSLESEKDDFPSQFGDSTITSLASQNANPQSESAITQPTSHSSPHSDPFQPPPLPRVVSEERSTNHTEKLSVSTANENSPSPEPRVVIDEKVAIDEKIKTIQERRDVQLAELNKKVAEYARRISELVKQRCESHIQKEKLQKEIDDAEAQQVEASENEDFEKADQLGELMISLRQNLSDIIPKESVLLAEEENLVASLILEEKSINVVYQRSASEVKQLLELKGILIQKESAEARIKTSQEEYKLQQDMDRINSERSHALLDRKLVEEREETLKKAIADQTKGAINSRDELSKKKANLDAEIEELEKKLAAKKTESDKCKATIIELDAEISLVTSRYQGELTKFSKERSDLDVKLEKSEKELSLITEAKGRIDTQTHSLQELERSHAQIFDGVLGEIQTIELSKNKVEEHERKLQSYLKQRRVFIEIVNNTNDDISGLEEQFQQLDSQVSLERAQVIVLQGEVEKLSQALAAIDESLPQLETKKKAAAAAKQYKEAAKYASDIKSAQSSRVDISVEMEDATAKLNAQLAHSRSLELKLSEVVRALNDMKENRGALRVKNMTKSLEQLRPLMSGLQSSDNLLLAKSLEDELRFFESILDASNKTLAQVKLNTSAIESNKIIEPTESKEESVVMEAKTLSLEEFSLLNTQQEPEVQSSGDEKGGNQLAEQTALSNEVRLGQLVQKIEELETQLEAAAAEENFDEAANIQEQIGALEAEIESLKSLAA